MHLPPPDPDLQAFHRLRRYFRDDRAPWSKARGEMAFLTTAPRETASDLLVTKAQFSDALRHRFERELRAEATNGLVMREPLASARSIRMRPGARAFIIFAAVSIAAFTAPSAFIALVGVAASAIFLAISTARIWLAASAAAPDRRQSPPELSDRDLPTVTILVPLFREAHALPGLAAAIDALDYPRDRLDVKLLLEAADRETYEEARRLRLDERFDLIVVPPSHPQTKPKACNYGLHCARGDLLVIYDAEDEPEPDQLRIAAATFAAAGDDLACVQAKLNFYNPDENWLTRLFTLEYCLWFDSFLPALDRLSAPVPLGGTSNIFRTDILAEVGGWDPYNVTEDADLGLRLARRGYKTSIIRSTTFEEANCDPGNWMRQRSRWMKGYLQTWLVHRRDMKFSGWRGALSVDFFIGGTVIAALANPLLWLVFAMQSVAGAPGAAFLPEWLASLSAAALFGGNLGFIGLAAIAPLKRRLFRLAPFAIFVPVYWWMMSIAAWRAVHQLLTRPSFWEKTDHGLSAEAKARRLSALEALGLE
jgi:cellulose synthase/poly-beta-1,6-N-acetylglucosamine synthase-like glycosyltransferase